ncbi:DUF4251 domain-containing protein [Mucilaginibacter terrae]|uniref:DUF4251 domain-containing protein n=1 Tax=Mucilaginibacter terrae TaxID=1955052 RepID=UPI0036280CA3
MKALKYIALFTSLFAGSALVVSAQTTPVQKQRTHLIADNSSTVLTQDSSKKTTKAERNALKAADVKKLIESKQFTFHARYANPLGGGVMSLNGQLINISPQGTGHIYLTSDYDVRIRPDSVITFLPYFGRTTFAPSLNPTDGGVKFTSTKFEYDAKTGKKGNTVITITPQDAQYNRKMILDIADNGVATLQMIITNRNAISYDGFIEEI